MLRKRKNKNTGRSEWALVSRKTPSKILKWFGVRKPSHARFMKEERRAQMFKHMSPQRKALQGNPAGDWFVFGFLALVAGSAIAAARERR